MKLQGASKKKGEKKGMNVNKGWKSGLFSSVRWIF